MPANSSIAKATNCTLRHRDVLARFYEGGRYIIDSNHREREIKPFVIAGKNFLFSGSQKEAMALCLHFRLIGSVKF